MEKKIKKNSSSDSNSKNKFSFNFKITRKKDKDIESNYNYRNVELVNTTGNHSKFYNIYIRHINEITDKNIKKEFEWIGDCYVVYSRYGRIGSPGVNGTFNPYIHYLEANNKVSEIIQEKVKKGYSKIIDMKKTK